MNANQAAQWVRDHETLWLIRWEDPVVESLGHHASSEYVETFWLPHVGPTSVLMLRRLAAGLEGRDDFFVGLESLAASLGLGRATGVSSPVVRTFARLCAFGFAEPRGERLAVRTVLPPLARRFVDRLPAHLRVAHHKAMEGVA